MVLSRGSGRDALRDIDAALVQQRHEPGAEHHHVVVPFRQIGEPDILGRCDVAPTARVEPGVEEDAILDGWLAVAQPLERAVIE